jgi:hypothetical protein
MGVTGTLATLATLLTACTPAPKPVTALRYVNNRPILLIACPTINSGRISLYVDDDSPSAAWRIDREATDVPLPTEVTLFETPPGWTVSEQSLTTLQPGVGYSVAMRGRSNSTPIRFTIANLAALRTGQVLVGKPTGPAKAVRESQFRATARNACD